MDFSMGTHGGFVWSAVALTVVVVIANVWSARAALRDAKARARRAAGLEGGEGGR